MCEPVVMHEPQRPESRDVVEPGGPDEGGDPACWAHRVCPQCGRLNEVERPTVCEGCGARFPDY